MRPMHGTPLDRIRMELEEGMIHTHGIDKTVGIVEPAYGWGYVIIMPMAWVDFVDISRYEVGGFFGIEHICIFSYLNLVILGSLSSPDGVRR